MLVASSVILPLALKLTVVVSILSVIVVTAGVASIATASKLPPVVDAMVALALVSTSAKTSESGVTANVLLPLVAPARITTFRPLLKVTVIAVSVALSTLAV